MNIIRNNFKVLVILMLFTAFIFTRCATDDLKEYHCTFKLQNNGTQYDFYTINSFTLTENGYYKIQYRNDDLSSLTIQIPSNVETGATFTYTDKNTNGFNLIFQYFLDGYEVDNPFSCTVTSWGKMARGTFNGVLEGTFGHVEMFEGSFEAPVK